MNSMPTSPAQPPATNSIPTSPAQPPATTTEPATIGWLGTGRMGAVMARRLLAAGNDVTVWNRTRSKTDELVAAGAKVVETIAELAAADVVFTMVSTPAALAEVLLGPSGLLTGARAPQVLVDCSTVDDQLSARIREAAARAGVRYLACPVSGNPHVVADGRAVLVASGPRETFDAVAPMLNTIARAAVWSGEGEQARLVKICHNLYLGLLVQALCEVTTLAEKSGVPRGAFLDFLNNTGLATDWVRRRTPDLLSLDWTPTFTTELLRKDFDLGMEAARTQGMSMPLTALASQLIATAIGRGYREADFLSLFEVQAASSGMTLRPQ